MARKPASSSTRRTRRLPAASFIDPARPHQPRSSILPLLHDLRNQTARGIAGCRSVGRSFEGAGSLKRRLGSRCRGGAQVEAAYLSAVRAPRAADRASLLYGRRADGDLFALRRACAGEDALILDRLDFAGELLALAGFAVGGAPRTAPSVVVVLIRGRPLLATLAGAGPGSRKRCRSSGGTSTRQGDAHDRRVENGRRSACRRPDPRLARGTFLVAERVTLGSSRRISFSPR